MFPAPEITLTGMDPNSSYIVLMDVVPADNVKYKWTKTNWIVQGKCESYRSSEIFVHPDSPLLGAQWMKKAINFKTMKLTNNTSNPAGNVIFCLYSFILILNQIYKALTKLFILKMF